MKWSLAAALRDPSMGRRQQMLQLTASPDRLDAEAGHIKIYGILSLGSEKALLSKMKNSVKERRRKG